MGSEDRTTERKPPQKSAVSAHVNPFKILDHVLNTKVELAVGEIIGVSCELLTLLMDSIKIKIQPSAPIGLRIMHEKVKTNLRHILTNLLGRELTNDKITSCEYEVSHLPPPMH